jgi:hypothetical protein
VRTGSATLPLHGGHCPPWLFARMRTLAAAVAEVVVDAAGPGEMLVRLSDPVWLQAFGSLLGFDWHSSGLTTVALAALKEGLGERAGELGLFLCGGKGLASRATPREIEAACERHALAVDAAALQRASRLAAKVDNAAVQDGFTIYHHVFAFTADGRWAVVQQGMDEDSGLARRYHWLGDAETDFVTEPHAAVRGAPARREVLNLVAAASGASRDAALELARHGTAEMLRILRGLESGAYDPVARRYARAHPIPQAGRMEKILRTLYDLRPADYAALLGVEGVGPATVRALAMTAEVAFGARPAFTDPVRYAFAHGGKDGHPFPVCRADYDRTIAAFERAIRRSRLGRTEQLEALRRLAALGSARG